MSPLQSPCDGFAQAIVLRADRELGPAEAAALEAHLEACAACRVRSRRVQALSSILKGWDAENNQRVEPPARLLASVLAEVQETARHRRHEERFYRALRWSQAACVVLALGAAIAFGLDARFRERTVDGPAAPAPVPVASWPTLPASPAPLEIARPAPRRLPSLSPSPAPLDPGVLRAAEEPLVVATARLLLEERFRETFREPGVWHDMGDGVQALVTLNAAQFLTERKPELERKTTGFVYAPSKVRQDPPVHASDVLPIPRVEDGLATWLPQLVFQSFDTVAVRFAVIPPRPVTGLVEGPADEGVLDAETAVREKVLTFFDGETPDVVIAMARANPKPIFLPAGEILVGGECERVVARSTWIPATDTNHAEMIPCVCVSIGRPRREDRPTPTPLGVVAGPGLRSLLAREEPAESVLRHVRSQLLLKGFSGRAVGLSQIYGQPDVLRMSREWSRLFPHAAAGVAVLGRDGSLLGVETAALPDRDAAALFGRLLVGYDVEAQLRDIVRERAGVARQPVVGSDLESVLAPLLSASDALATVAESDDVRVFRFLSGDAVLEALQVGDRAAFAAILRPW